MEELLKIFEKYENFTITEALKDCKNTFDLLCIVNYLLSDIIDETRNNIEDEDDQKDFNELIKIKDKILIIKNKNMKMYF